MAGCVDDAVAALTDHADGVPLAGGTWIMRAPVRGEALAPFYVGLAHIRELNTVDVSAGEIRIGACVTHARLASALAGIPGYGGLSAAAASAANPAIRQMATVGGNLCAAAFPASDLAPSFLSLNADVDLRGPGGDERLPLDIFLKRRASLPPGTLLTTIVVPRSEIATAHARLPLRKAGDYPVAIVSIAAGMRNDGTVEDIRIGVGSVETAPRRWRQLEERLTGRRLDATMAHEIATSERGAFTGRDSVEAPAWYRVQVLPVLVRRATQAILRGQ